MMLANTEGTEVVLGCQLLKQLMKQFIAGDAMMRGYAGQNGGECSEFQWVVVGQGDVVFALNRTGQANVATCLASGGITQAD
jgi:hypothetical protein